MEDVIQTTGYEFSQSGRDDDFLRVASKCWERVMDAAVKVISERFSVDLVPNVILMSELLAITHVTLYI